MFTLAIDTCGFSYSIAILNGDKILTEFKSNERNMQCEELITKIGELLIQTSLDYKDLDLLAVTSGPGTFNGVRIGMSTAHGISLAKDTKILTVSTLEVIAYKEKACAICFTPDSQVGFFQRFDKKFNPISEISAVGLNELDKAVLVFDIDRYNESDISNAVIAGFIAIKPGREKNTLFYGKPPSIHVKNPR